MKGFLTVNMMEIYNRLPVKLQNIACAAEGRRLARLRYGGDFTDKLSEYLKNKEKSIDEVLSIRDAKLRRMVRYCYENVPFYIKLFDEAGIDPESVRDPDDISALPILDKQTVRHNVDSLRPRDMRVAGKYITEHTSGSTGSSLVFPQSVGNVRDLWAVFWRFWTSLGLAFGTTYADFGSRTVVPQSQAKPPYWRESPSLFQVKFSAFHGNPETYQHYYEEINRRRLTWIHGYPTCIVPFATYVVENGLEFDTRMAVVTTSAENLYDYQRALLRRAFGVEPHSLYALTEATACISESVDHKMVIDEDYSLVELLPAGDYYRIVGTNLSNFAFPLLRYDTGDLALFSGETQSGWRVIEGIDGRSGELLTMPDGGRIGAFSALFVDSSHIEEAQLVQHADYSITIRFVPVDDCYQNDLARAEERLRQRTRNQVGISVQRMDRIPRTARGKLRYVVSEV